MTCWPEPSAFTRFAIYAFIGLFQVILLFTPALQVVVCDLALWLFFGSEPLFPGVPDFVNGMLVLVLLWWIYIHLPKFIQKALRSLWQSKKKDKH